MRTTFTLIISAITLFLGSEDLLYPLHAVLTTAEICDNAIDDDGDGLVDLNDEDCECVLIEPVSLIPNPSFEEMDCCPQFRSQLHCASGWIQASEATTDYIHECGFPGWPDLLPLKPFPDGQGIVGFRDGRNIVGSAEKNWKEYAGACLTSPLKANNQYTFEFYVGFVNIQVSPPMDITFFGAVDCSFLPFGIGNNSYGCPTNGPGWVQLGARRVSGNGWIKTSITVTPDRDIHAIAIGPPCAPNSSDENLYYFFDNLILAETKFFELVIVPSGKECTADFRLSIIEDTAYTYQWYKEGVAIPEATGSTYDAALGEGKYNVVVMDNGVCRVSRDFIYRYPYGFGLERKVICPGDEYDFNGKTITSQGFYVDTLRRAGECDSIINLDLKISSDEVTYLNARIFKGESYPVGNFNYGEPGSYEVPLLNNLGCDSLVLLDLEFYDIYIPNAFSPNEDGINDVFEIYNREPDLTIKNIRIFNRWGAVLWSTGIENADGSLGWDGTSNGAPAEPAVYIYQVTIGLDNGREKVITGDVSILK